VDHHRHRAAAGCWRRWLVRPPSPTVMIAFGRAFRTAREGVGLAAIDAAEAMLGPSLG
jgi:hypothetical protein